MPNTTNANGTLINIGRLVVPKLQLNTI